MNKFFIHQKWISRWSRPPKLSLSSLYLALVNQSLVIFDGNIIIAIKWL
jgi:hypothetical protein